MDKAVDWRYATPLTNSYEYRAIWSNTVEQQQHDGRWAFDMESFGYGYYSDELETAFMLLVLSDEVVRDTGRFSQLRVTTTIPGEIASGLTINPFQSQATAADGSVQLAWGARQLGWSGRSRPVPQYVLPAGLAMASRKCKTRWS